MKTDYLNLVRERIRSTPVGEPLPPWKLAGGSSIGGLTEVGFGEDSDLLLVVSSQGRGVFNCITGERVARDREEPNDGWYDNTRLVALGIGPLKEQVIRLSGLHGGGLPIHTADGWSVQAITMPWPVEHLLLEEPFKTIYDDKASVAKLAVVLGTRAFGFSPTGRSLIWAISSDLAIYTRESN
ncbi:MAG: hypothetical protein AAF078_03310 [Planctomycetota bacterium]